MGTGKVGPGGKTGPGGGRGGLSRCDRLVRSDFNSCCNSSTINPNVVVHCYINDIPFSRPVA